jgi:hypothetical protein
MGIQVWMNRKDLVLWRIRAGVGMGSQLLVLQDIKKPLRSKLCCVSYI